MLKKYIQPLAFFMILIAAFVFAVLLTSVLRSGILQKLTIGGVITNQPPILLSDDFESYAVNTPPTSSVYHSGSTAAWYQASEHNADIDGGSWNNDPSITPTGYHRVFDSSTIPVHSGSKALKYLTSSGSGCKVGMKLQNANAQSGGGNIMLTDFWFMFPNNWLIGTDSAYQSRPYLYSLWWYTGAQFRVDRYSASSDRYHWLLNEPSGQQQTLADYSMADGVWHHVQVVYDFSSHKYLDVLIDGNRPFTSQLGQNSWAPAAGATLGFLELWVQSWPKVPLPAGNDCALDTGFQTIMYLDDVTISQLSSWSGGGSTPTTQTQTSRTTTTTTTTTHPTTSTSTATTSTTHSTTASLTSSITSTTALTTTTTPIVCQEGSYKCVGNSLERCTYGSWNYVDSCVYGCSNGECLPATTTPPQIQLNTILTIAVSTGLILGAIAILIYTLFKKSSANVFEALKKKWS